MNALTASYSPDDNKLRLRCTARLDAELYERVRAAGFRWAPRQGLFVAPAWTPVREDLLIELCGEIGDEATSLAQRAQVRAERFGGYADRRCADAEAARAAVARVADAIPLGQPILVGHHSERRARRDVERIESGMRRAAQLWDTAQYWKERAAGALRSAASRESAAVRQRRIGRLEAERRACQRSLGEAQCGLALWRREGLTLQEALALAEGSQLTARFSLAEFPRDPPASQYEGERSVWSALHDGLIGAAQARELCLRGYAAMADRAQRWVAHCEHRIDYERALLAQQGGTAAEPGDARLRDVSPEG